MRACLPPLLLLLLSAGARAWAPPPRLMIINGTFVRSSDGARVVPLGANYVLKAQPYFPEERIVARNARSIASGAAEMKYRPSDGRVVVPVVRLGVLMEAAMPNEAGVFDASWQANLEATVNAFAEAGVYVFLDIHQDAMAATSGGEGFPTWMTAMMQETAGDVPGCSTCHARNSYITSPEHPLACSVYELAGLLKSLGFDLPLPRIANATDPWRAYSVNGGAGDSRRMSVGNVNMRVNNHDGAWGHGILIMSQQVQNVAWRFYRSHRYPAEKAMFFDPYVAFVKYLCGVWQRHSNVVAVELLNEPPVGGLPDLIATRSVRKDLFDFYAAVVREVDADENVPRAPFAIEDLTGNNGRVAMTMALLDAIGIETALSDESLEILRRTSAQGRLVMSFHWYPSSCTDDSLRKWTRGALKLASDLGGAPIFLSEYFAQDRDTMARYMALCTELGCDAVTYWHFVDSEYTGRDGWFTSPQLIVYGQVDWAAWQQYEPSVADGSYWGASICGASGGKADLLSHVPPLTASPLSAKRRPGVPSVVLV
mmetsp:Transcript_88105/g.254282  ORF Transcript_88105/g.254282 Transcript_88105/m.254282 type:complete len:540 (-) Transcript_88105:9-1628(-)